MKNSFIPSANLRSSGELIAQAGVFIPDKRTHWSLQKAVPHNVLVTRALNERKAALTALADDMRAKHAAESAPKPLGIFAQKVENGFKVLGFGVVVPEVGDVFAIADREGREFVKIDGAEVSRP